MKTYFKMVKDHSPEDEIVHALTWANGLGVDGFKIKILEQLSDEKSVVFLVETVSVVRPCRDLLAEQQHG